MKKRFKDNPAYKLIHLIDKNGRVMGHWVKVDQRPRKEWFTK